ncbi:unnamed protein product, partial [Ectocarpus sp. 8 AP-2014]
DICRIGPACRARRSFSSIAAEASLDPAPASTSGPRGPTVPPTHPLPLLLPLVVEGDPPRQACPGRSKARWLFSGPLAWASNGATGLDKPSSSPAERFSRQDPGHDRSEHTVSGMSQERAEL